MKCLDLLVFVVFLQSLDAFKGSEYKSFGSSVNSGGNGRNAKILDNFRSKTNQILQANNLRLGNNQKINKDKRSPKISGAGLSESFRVSVEISLASYSGLYTTLDALTSSASSTLSSVSSELITIINPFLDLTGSAADILSPLTGALPNAFPAICRIVSKLDIRDIPAIVVDSINDVQRALSGVTKLVDGAGKKTSTRKIDAAVTTLAGSIQVITNTVSLVAEAAATGAASRVVEEAVALLTLILDTVLIIADITLVSFASNVSSLSRAPTPTLNTLVVAINGTLQGLTSVITSIATSQTASISIVVRTISVTLKTITTTLNTSLQGILGVFKGLKITVTNLRKSLKSVVSNTVGILTNVLAGLGGKGGRGGKGEGNYDNRDSETNSIITIKSSLNAASSTASVVLSNVTKKLSSVLRLLSQSNVSHKAILTKLSNSLSRIFDILLSAVKNLIAGLGDEVAGALSTTLGNIQRIISKLISIVNGVSKKISIKSVDNLVDGIARNVQVLFSTVTAITVTVSQAINVVTLSVVNEAVIALQYVQSTVLCFIDYVLSYVSSAVVSIFGTVSAKLSHLTTSISVTLQSVTKIISYISGSISGNLSKVLIIIAPTISQIGQTIDISLSAISKTAIKIAFSIEQITSHIGGVATPGRDQPQRDQQQRDKPGKGQSGRKPALETVEPAEIAEPVETSKAVQTVERVEPAIKEDDNLSRDLSGIQNSDDVITNNFSGSLQTAASSASQVIQRLNSLEGSSAEVREIAGKYFDDILSYYSECDEFKGMTKRISEYVRSLGTSVQNVLAGVESANTDTDSKAAFNILLQDFAFNLQLIISLASVTFEALNSVSSTLDTRTLEFIISLVYRLSPILFISQGVLSNAWSFVSSNFGEIENLEKVLNVVNSAVKVFSRLISTISTSGTSTIPEIFSGISSIVSALCIPLVTSLSSVSLRIPQVTADLSKFTSGPTQQIIAQTQETVEPVETVEKVEPAIKEGDNLSWDLSWIQNSSDVAMSYFSGTLQTAVSSASQVIQRLSSIDGSSSEVREIAGKYFDDILSYYSESDELKSITKEISEHVRNLGKSVQSVLAGVECADTDTYFKATFNILLQDFAFKLQILISLASLTFETINPVASTLDIRTLEFIISLVYRLSPILFISQGVLSNAWSFVSSNFGEIENLEKVLNVVNSAVKVFSRLISTISTSGTIREIFSGISSIVSALCTPLVTSLSGISLKIPQVTVDVSKFTSGPSQETVATVEPVERVEPAIKEDDNLSRDLSGIQNSDDVITNNFSGSLQTAASSASQVIQRLNSLEGSSAEVREIAGKYFDDILSYYSECDEFKGMTKRISEYVRNLGTSVQNVLAGVESANTDTDSKAAFNILLQDFAFNLQLIISLASVTFEALNSVSSTLDTRTLEFIISLVYRLSPILFISQGVLSNAWSFVSSNFGEIENLEKVLNVVNSAVKVFSRLISTISTSGTSTIPEIFSGISSIVSALCIPLVTSLSSVSLRIPQVTADLSKFTSGTTQQIIAQTQETVEPVETVETVEKVEPAIKEDDNLSWDLSWIQNSSDVAMSYFSGTLQTAVSSASQVIQRLSSIDGSSSEVREIAGKYFDDILSYYSESDELKSITKEISEHVRNLGKSVQSVLAGVECADTDTDFKATFNILLQDFAFKLQILISLASLTFETINPVASTLDIRTLEFIISLVYRLSPILFISQGVLSNAWSFVSSSFGEIENLEKVLNVVNSAVKVFSRLISTLSTSGTIREIFSGISSIVSALCTPLVTSLSGISLKIPQVTVDVSKFASGPSQQIIAQTQETVATVEPVERVEPAIKEDDNLSRDLSGILNSDNVITNNFSGSLQTAASSASQVIQRLNSLEGSSAEVREIAGKYFDDILSYYSECDEFKGMTKRISVYVRNLGTSVQNVLAGVESANTGTDSKAAFNILLQDFAFNLQLIISLASVTFEALNSVSSTLDTRTLEFIISLVYRLSPVLFISQGVMSNAWSFVSSNFGEIENLEKVLNVVNSAVKVFSRLISTISTSGTSTIPEIFSGISSIVSALCIPLVTSLSSVSLRIPQVTADLSKFTSGPTQQIIAQTQETVEPVETVEKVEPAIKEDDNLSWDLSWIQNSSDVAMSYFSGTLQTAVSSASQVIQRLSSIDGSSSEVREIAGKYFDDILSYYSESDELKSITKEISEHVRNLGKSVQSVLAGVECADTDTDFKATFNILLQDFAFKLQILISLASLTFETINPVASTLDIRTLEFIISLVYRLSPILFISQGVLSNAWSFVSSNFGEIENLEKVLNVVNSAVKVFSRLISTISTSGTIREIFSGISSIVSALCTPLVTSLSGISLKIPQVTVDVSKFTSGPSQETVATVEPVERVEPAIKEDDNLSRDLSGIQNSDDVITNNFSGSLQTAASSASQVIQRLNSLEGSSAEVREIAGKYFDDILSYYSECDEFKGMTKRISEYVRNLGTSVQNVLAGVESANTDTDSKAAFNILLQDFAFNLQLIISLASVTFEALNSVSSTLDTRTLEFIISLVYRLSPILFISQGVLSNAWSFVSSNFGEIENLEKVLNVVNSAVKVFSRLISTISTSGTSTIPEIFSGISSIVSALCIPLVTSLSSVSLRIPQVTADLSKFTSGTTQQIIAQTQETVEPVETVEKVEPAIKEDDNLSWDLSWIQNSSDVAMSYFSGTLQTAVSSASQVIQRLSSIDGSSSEVREIAGKYFDDILSYYSESDELKSITKEISEHVRNLGKSVQSVLAGVECADTDTDFKATFNILLQDFAFKLQILISLASLTFETINPVASTLDIRTLEFIISLVYRLSPILFISQGVLSNAWSFVSSSFGEIENLEKVLNVVNSAVKVFSRLISTISTSGTIREIFSGISSIVSALCTPLVTSLSGISLKIPQVTVDVSKFASGPSQQIIAQTQETVATVEPVERVEPAIKEDDNLSRDLSGILNSDNVITNNFSGSLQTAASSASQVIQRLNSLEGSSAEVREIAGKYFDDILSYYSECDEFKGMTKRISEYVRNLGTSVQNVLAGVESANTGTDSKAAFNILLQDFAFNLQLIISLASVTFEALNSVSSTLDTRTLEFIISLVYRLSPVLFISQGVMSNAWSFVSSNFGEIENLEKVLNVVNSAVKVFSRLISTISTSGTSTIPKIFSGISSIVSALCIPLVTSLSSVSLRIPQVTADLSKFTSGPTQQIIAQTQETVEPVETVEKVEPAIKEDDNLSWDLSWIQNSSDVAMSYFSGTLQTAVSSASQVIQRLSSIGGSSSEVREISGKYFDDILSYYSECDEFKGMTKRISEYVRNLGTSVRNVLAGVESANTDTDSKAAFNILLQDFAFNLQLIISLASVTFEALNSVSSTLDTRTLEFIISLVYRLSPILFISQGVLSNAWSFVSSNFGEIENLEKVLNVVNSAVKVFSRLISTISTSGTSTIPEIFSCISSIVSALCIPLVTSLSSVSLRIPQVTADLSKFTSGPTQQIIAQTQETVEPVETVEKVEPAIKEDDNLSWDLSWIQNSSDVAMSYFSGTLQTAVSSASQVIQRLSSIDGSSSEVREIAGKYFDDILSYYSESDELKSITKEISEHVRNLGKSVQSVLAGVECADTDTDFKATFNILLQDFAFKLQLIISLASVTFEALNSVSSTLDTRTLEFIISLVYRLSPILFISQGVLSNAWSFVSSNFGEIENLEKVLNVVNSAVKVFSRLISTISTSGTSTIPKIFSGISSIVSALCIPLVTSLSSVSLRIPQVTADLSKFTSGPTQQIIAQTQETVEPVETVEKVEPAIKEDDNLSWDLSWIQNSSDVAMSYFSGTLQTAVSSASQVIQRLSSIDGSSSEVREISGKYFDDILSYYSESDELKSITKEISEHVRNLGKSVQSVLAGVECADTDTDFKATFNILLQDFAFKLQILISLASLTFETINPVASTLDIRTLEFIISLVYRLSPILFISQGVLSNAWSFVSSNFGEIENLEKVLNVVNSAVKVFSRLISTISTSGTSTIPEIFSCISSIVSALCIPLVTSLSSVSLRIPQVTADLSKFTSGPIQQIIAQTQETVEPVETVETVEKVEPAIKEDDNLSWDLSWIQNSSDVAMSYFSGTLQTAVSSASQVIQRLNSLEVSSAELREIAGKYFDDILSYYSECDEFKGMTKRISEYVRNLGTSVRNVLADVESANTDTDSKAAFNILLQDFAFNLQLIISLASVTFEALNSVSSTLDTRTLEFIISLVYRLSPILFISQGVLSNAWSFVSSNFGEIENLEKVLNVVNSAVKVFSRLISTISTSGTSTIPEIFSCISSIVSALCIPLVTSLSSVSLRIPQVTADLSKFTSGPSQQIIAQTQETVATVEPVERVEPAIKEDDNLSRDLSGILNSDDVITNNFSGSLQTAASSASQVIQRLNSLEGSPAEVREIAGKYFDDILSYYSECDEFKGMTKRISEYVRNLGTSVRNVLADVESANTDTDSKAAFNILLQDFAFNLQLIISLASVTFEALNSVSSTLDTRTLEFIISLVYRLSPILFISQGVLSNAWSFVSSNFGEIENLEKVLNVVNSAVKVFSRLISTISTSGTSTIPEIFSCISSIVSALCIPLVTSLSSVSLRIPQVTADLSKFTSGPGSFGAAISSTVTGSVTIHATNAIDKAFEIITQTLSRLTSIRGLVDKVNRYVLKIKIVLRALIVLIGEIDKTKFTANCVSDRIVESINKYVDQLSDLVRILVDNVADVTNESNISGDLSVVLTGVVNSVLALSGNVSTFVTGILEVLSSITTSGVATIETTISFSIKTLILSINDVVATLTAGVQLLIGKNGIVQSSVRNVSGLLSSTLASLSKSLSSIGKSSSTVNRVSGIKKLGGSFVGKIKAIQKNSGALAGRGSASSSINLTASLTNVLKDLRNIGGGAFKYNIRSNGCKVCNAS